MSQRSRAAKAAARGRSEGGNAPAPEPSPPRAGASFGDLGLGGGYGGANNGYQGADWSRLRGYVYFPQLDTRVAVSSYTRTEMLRRARFLYANQGFARRIVNGLSRMVTGTGLTPHATTRDPVFNKGAQAYWAAYANSRFSYDLGGRYNCAGSQYNCKRFQFRDGDYLQAQARTAAGDPANVFYEGHQISSNNFSANSAYAGPEADPGGTGLDPITGAATQCYDGVILGAHNRAIGYRVRAADDSYVVIPSREAIFGCNYQAAGQSRGTTIFEAAIPNMLDAAEIQGYIKAGVKLANQFGYWVETKPEITGDLSGADRLSGRTHKIPDGAGGKLTVERVYGAGAIPNLLPGQELKFASTAHPHPNNLSLLDYLVRDVAWGAGISPEILWNIAALGGANTRFVLADAQSWIELEQQDLVDTKLGREWVWVIGDAIARRKLAPPRDGNALIKEWWLHEWIPPPRLTVDWGRDGKLQLEQIKLGALTFKKYYGWQGDDWREQLDQSLDEIAYIKAGLDTRKITWADWSAFRNTSGNGAAQSAIAADPDLADDPDDPDAPTPDPADARAQLAAIAKHPGRAQAWLQALMRESA